MKTKKIILSSVFGLVGVAVVLAAAVYFLFPKKIEQWTVQRKLQGNQEWMEVYKRVQAVEEKIKNKPEDEIALLVNVAFEWKTLGDLTKDVYFYQKALDVYKQGIEKSAGKNIAFYWNAGKVAENMNDFVTAEALYQEAIRVSPGYNESYRYLAELYILKMKKSDQEVLQVYADGLKGTDGDANIFLDQCSYLRRVKRNKEALECYELLVESYPDNKLFEQTVDELKKEVAATP